MVAIWLTVLSSHQQKLFLQNRWKLMARLWALALVPISFCVFVVYNQGIVVGDRANHSPQLHLVQPLYFCLFTISFLPQVFLHPSR